MASRRSGKSKSRAPASAGAPANSPDMDATADAPGTLAEPAGASVLDLLAQDHREIEALLRQLATTPSSEGEERSALFSELQSLLQAHSRAEEEVVYRRLQQRDPQEFTVLEAFEEHHIVDVLLQELAPSSPGGAGWTAKLRVLEELVQHHIKEEELDLFAVIRQKLGEIELRQMAREFRLLKHQDLEKMLGPIRRATPAFAGRATIYAQAAAGRMVRRGELYLRRVLSRMPA